MATTLSNAPSPADEGTETGWSPRLVCSLVSIVLILELLTISYVMAATALPQIAATFQTTQAGWVMAAFLLGGAVMSPPLGRLADAFGKRRVLLAVLGLALVGSVMSAVATSYGVFIAGRALQGLLSACMFLSYSLMRDVYPRRALALSVSIATAGMGVIAVPAPWLTGWLLDAWGYKSVFWTFAIAIAVLAVILRLSTDESPLRVRASADLFGALLLGGGLAGVLVGVSFAPVWGWSDGTTLRAIGLGAVLLVGWVVWSLTRTEPMIDVRFLARRPVILTALCAGLTMGASSVFTQLLPILAMTPSQAQLGYGFSLDATGYAKIQAPLGATMAVTGIVVGILVSRGRSPKLVMFLGQVVMLGAGSGLAFAHGAQFTAAAWVAVMGVGYGLAAASIPSLVFCAVPPERQGSMSSMTQVFQGGLAATLGVVAFTVLNSNVAMAGEGFLLYSDSGMTKGLLIGAAGSLVGVLCAWALPRGLSSSELDARA
jgi:MFS family permease